MPGRIDIADVIEALCEVGDWEIALELARLVDEQSISLTHLSRAS
jgi:hypothetical protein